jgi:hypothetical protein
MGASFVARTGNAALTSSSTNAKAPRSRHPVIMENLRSWSMRRAHSLRLRWPQIDSGSPGNPITAS